MTPQTLFGSNTAEDQARTARMVAEREGKGTTEGWYCVYCRKPVEPCDVTYEENHALCGYPATGNEIETSTDAILALLAREGMTWSVYGTLGSVEAHLTRKDESIIVGNLKLPNQQPPTLAHAWRCLLLAAKGVNHE